MCFALLPTAPHKGDKSQNRQHSPAVIGCSAHPKHGVAGSGEKESEHNREHDESGMLRPVVAPGQTPESGQPRQHDQRGLNEGV